MEFEEMRREGEMETDSDHEDAEYGADEIEGDSGWLGNSLESFHTDLDSHQTGTVRRRAKTIVTPKMAMESFRLSFLNDDQDVNFDAILGELYELESQLNSAQTELSRSLGAGCHHPPPPAAFQDGDRHDSNDSTHMSEQEELDQLAVEITRSLNYNKAASHCHKHHRHYHHHHTGTGSGHAGGEGHCDHAETDSAFSDNASLPSSESLASMVTVSSSADTTSSSSGDTSSMNSTTCGINHSEVEQTARIKAEKIRIALEKIKDSKIRKLFVRAFAKDGSSKSILVDEKMSVGQVCSQLADKNHMRLNHRLSVVESMPELLMERVLEDHDSLVDSIVMWTRDSKNKVMFEERMDKYDLFINPEKYLLSPASLNQDLLTAQHKDTLIQGIFAPDSVSVPSVEGALYLKSDGKKAWKKFFFVLRASGLYYNPKGKASKNPKDLVCFMQFEYVEVYRGLGWKKKYHSPTDYCFALKHPQIQKKTSKYIRYFCAETEIALDQWVMGIRTVKLGKQMLYNYEQLMHEISMWDLRQQEPGAVSVEDCQILNHNDLSDSRMSIPKQDTHHSGSHVLNPCIVHSTANESSRDVISIEVLAIPPHKSSEFGSGADGRSLSGSIGSSSAGSMMSESGHKTPVKRVSFSATHSIINGNSSENTVKHRDSIISASTDSSEDSNSSGETRLGLSFRGKMRARLPVTTETTRQLADMCNVPIDETAEGIYAETHHRVSSAGISRDRRRSSINEGRSSNGLDNGLRSSHMKNSSLSPNLKQHSLDSEAEVSLCGKHVSPSLEGHYQHVRRKSEPSVVPHIAIGKEDEASSIYSTVYSPLREEQKMFEEVDVYYSTNGQKHSEQLCNQIRSPAPEWSNQVSSDDLCPTAIPPPPEFREAISGSNHASLPSHAHHDKASPPPPASHVQIQSMQVPPPPPPVLSSSSGDAPEATNNQHKLHYLKESPYGTATSVHTSHSKSSPPPTFPKPHNSAANNVSSISSPPVAIPKQPPPPPPLRLCSNESGITSRPGFDSVSGSPIHVPILSPTPPIASKLPPPTLPKTSSATAAVSTSVTGSSIKSSLSSKSPSSDGQSKKENGQSHSPSRQEGHPKSVTEEMAGCPPQSPSLSFLSDLSKKPHPESRADNPSGEISNGQPSPALQQHRRSASAGGMISKTDRKPAPPPPPKRSENTKLSGELARQQQHSESTHNGSSLPIPDPIYENFDGIMDIDELPPPPPELLMDLPPTECEDQSSGSTKKSKPPPPPPKRSKETQLCSH